MKRLVAAALVVALVLALGGLPAWADEVTQEDPTEIVDTGETGDGEETGEIGEDENLPATEETEGEDEETDEPTGPAWDVTGTWSLVTKLGETEYPQSLELTMDTTTGAVTGTGTYEAQNYAVSGTVTGDTIVLRREGDTYWADFEGTITESSIQGTWADSNQNSGTWAATGTAVAIAPVTQPDGLTWLPPVSLSHKVHNPNATLPIKFQLGATEEEQVEPELRVTCGEFMVTLSLKYSAEEEKSVWMGHFHPEVTGEHTAEVWLGETLTGSISFLVGKPGKHGPESEDESNEGKQNKVNGQLGKAIAAKAKVEAPGRNMVKAKAHTEANGKGRGK